MEIIFLPEAEEDLDFWVKSGNKTILKKIAQLVEAITESPFEGIGKPEPLKYDLTGCWSRRINAEHRLVYEILDNKILIHSAKGHYI
jgi:toxin YoeB